MKKLINKVTRSIGMWFLSSSNAESMQVMSDKVVKLAQSRNEDFSRVSLNIIHFRPGEIEYEYEVYIFDGEIYSGKTFNEAYQKLKGRHNKNMSKRKETLI